MPGYGSGIGVSDSADKGAAPLPPHYPLDTITVQPGGPSDWYVLMTLKILKAGSFTLSGVTVRYGVGGRTGVEQYPDILIIQGSG
jgi:hypothetical protein